MKKTFLSFLFGLSILSVVPAAVAVVPYPESGMDSPAKKTEPAPTRSDRARPVVERLDEDERLLRQILKDIEQLRKELKRQNDGSVK